MDQLHKNQRRERECLCGFEARAGRIFPQKCNRHRRSDHDPSRQKTPDKLPIQHFLLRIAWRTTHRVFFRRIDSQSDCRQNVRPQIHAQNQHGCEWQRELEQNRGKNHKKFADVRRKNEPGEFFQIFVNSPPLLDRRDDRRERVVRQNHRCRLAGNFRPRTHRHADVGGFQCGSVVHSVACHRDNFAVFLQNLHDPHFLLRQRTRKNHFSIAIGKNFVEFRIAHFFDLFSRQNRRPLPRDSEFSCDRTGSFAEISGDHENSHSRGTTFFDCRRNLPSRWIEHSGESDENQIFFRFFRRIHDFSVRDFSLCERQNSKCGFCHSSIFAENFFSFFRGQFRNFFPVCPKIALFENRFG